MYTQEELIQKFFRKGYYFTPAQFNETDFYRVFMKLYECYRSIIHIIPEDEKTEILNECHKEMDREALEEYQREQQQEEEEIEEFEDFEDYYEEDSSSGDPAPAPAA